MGNLIGKCKVLRFFPELWLSRYRWSRLQGYTRNFNRGDLEFVVARYNEDISWAQPVRDFVKIYNKGPRVDFDCEQLPNVGREAHTYLYHICENYDNLAKRTVFFQARLNDRPEQALLSPSRYLNDTGFTGRLRGMKIPYDWRYTKDGMTASKHSWGKFLEDVLQVEFTSNFKFVPGAYFAVSRETIHARPRSYYASILENGNLDEACHPEEAHYMERAWSLLFGCK